MAGVRTARGGLGWVILVIALAVPGVLFYNWWSRLKADREKAVATKARERVPEGGVFQSSPNAKLVNPMAPAVSTEAAPAPDATAGDSIPDAAAAAMPPEPTPADDGAAPVANAVPDAATPPLAVSTMTASVPLRRDPTLSPFDRLRIQEEEDAKRRAAEDLANMNRARRAGNKPRKPKPVDPKALVELQGIISNPDRGFMAIVNNEVVAAGDFIGTTKIKIIKITDLGVTFDYQGKRFIKNVNRD
ncbi:MAG: hypothetical protein COV48_05110 [Elusimicrobia bacterium CG11_big_fil_rev_8_21_14_0_20_64_6]|nr:MAG: hypothetical protein COV48_05110 [Elusimicrobia bacterium CG11_big_fil_rev_8_21_14_0_20_64_6]